MHISEWFNSKVRNFVELPGQSCGSCRRDPWTFQVSSLVVKGRVGLERPQQSASFWWSTEVFIMGICGDWKVGLKPNPTFSSLLACGLPSFDGATTIDRRLWDPAHSTCNVCVSVKRVSKNLFGFAGFEGFVIWYDPDLNQRMPLVFVLTSLKQLHQNLAWGSIILEHRIWRITPSDHEAPSIARIVDPFKAGLGPRDS